MNIWSPKKRDEKLNYMHNNPVRRGLVKHPGGWPWSSWRFYFWNDASILGMDKML
jgi:putative transposase